jgi:ribosome biogenesis GTPase
MCPKFRGNQDDWLDDEHSSLKSKAARRKDRTKEFVPDEEVNAVVMEVFPKQSRVHLFSGDEALCSYRRAALFGTTDDGLRERSPVAVGDKVKVSLLSPDAGVIEGVAKRRNQLLRPAPDREERTVHVIAANVDSLVIVASPSVPEFSPGLVDRFLVAAKLGGITPLLCVNKIDLCSEQSGLWDRYKELGVEVLALSAKKCVGVDALKERISGQAVVFCGHSGVGKTSLLRALLSSEIGKIGTVSEFTGKGRHTTTVATMLKDDGGSKWIDTPGVREFGLAGIAADALSNHFSEFTALGCSGRGCTHLDEADCDARSLWRYPSFRRIHDSLASGEY